LEYHRSPTECGSRYPVVRCTTEQLTTVVIVSGSLFGSFVASFSCRLLLRFSYACSILRWESVALLSVAANILGDSSSTPTNVLANSTASSCRSGYHCFGRSSSHDRQLIDLHLVLVLSIRTPTVTIEVLRFVVGFFMSFETDSGLHSFKLNIQAVSFLPC
jgi:hypothetical protein